MSLPAIAKPADPDLRRLAAYITALEVEVDRLRRDSRLAHEEVRASVLAARRLCEANGPSNGARATLEEVGAALDGTATLLYELRDAPGYHPAYDQVIAVAVRPLAEQLFRRHLRLSGESKAELELELATEHVEWFPARLRHILDNLLSNALKYRDPDKAATRVRLRLRAVEGGYELEVSDNGVGMAPAQRDRAFDLLSRAAPARAAGLGVGLAVVKLLVEQSDGSLVISSGEGQGTTFTVSLPRYEIDDFLI